MSAVASKRNGKKKRSNQSQKHPDEEWWYSTDTELTLGDEEDYLYLGDQKVVKVKDERVYLKSTSNRFTRLACYTCHTRSPDRVPQRALKRCRKDHCQQVHCRISHIGILLLMLLGCAWSALRLSSPARASCSYGGHGH